ncbi:MAG: extracellular solute-binding protein, partial [Oscillospiraceae bacterium]
MKKVLALILSICLAATMLAGCAQKPTSTSTPASGSAVSKPTGKQLSGKVVYWAMWNEEEPEAKAIQKAIEMFEKDYPDCKVEVQWLGRSNSDLVGPALEGGEQIDLLDNFSYTNNSERWMDITDMMTGPALGQENITVAESILPILQIANTTEQAKAKLATDKYYGVQMNPWVVGVFYNKALFEQAGIKATPNTWAEFLDCCKKLKAAKIAPITCDDAYMTIIPNNYLARTAGLEMVAKLGESATDEAWQSDIVKNTFSAMEELSDYMSPNTATNKYPAGQQEFALGEAAMYMNASWMPSEVAETTGDDFKWGFFGYPTIDGSVEDSSFVSVGGIPMAVYKDSKNPEAAKEVLRYIVSKEAQDCLSENGGAPCTVGTEWTGARAECTTVIGNAKTVANLGCNLGSEFISAVFNTEMNKVL